MEREGASPRDVARVRPRDLTEAEVFQIFKKEQLLRAELLEELDM